MRSMLGSTTRWRRRLFGLPIWFSRGRQCHQPPLCSWRPRARRTRLSARWVECKRTAIASDKPGSSWSSANSPSRPVKLPLVGCPCRNPNATASFRSTWGMVLLISPMEHPRTRHWLGGVCGAHTRVTVMTVLREHGLKGALNAAVGA